MLTNQPFTKATTFSKAKPMTVLGLGWGTAAGILVMLGGISQTTAETANRVGEADKEAKLTFAVLYSSSATNHLATKQAEMSDWLQVEVKNAPAELVEAIEAKKKITLFLNGVPVKGLYSELCLDGNQVRARFHLEWTDASRTNWVVLLRKPHLSPVEFRVGLGLEDGCALLESGDDEGFLRFYPLSRLEFWFWRILWVIFVVAFALLCIKSELIRDSGPKPAAGQLRPYSLARTQMAIWFFFVVSAFVFLRLVMGSAFIQITGTILALIGIASGTALGAEVQDASKVNPLQREKKDLSAIAPAARTPEQTDRLNYLSSILNDQTTTVVSRSFVEDILTDEVGISFHRFQMAIWTVVLGCIFVMDVYKNLAMPEFSETLLGLMGISSGTYLGFMMTEKHSSEEQKKSP